MKVAILVPTFFDYSGIDRVAEQQAEEYSKEGCEVAVFTFAANHELKNAKLEIVGMPKNVLLQRFYRLAFPLDVVKTIRCIKKLKNYNLIISHHYPMNWLAYIAKKLYNITYIYHNHVVVSDVFLGCKERIYLKLFRFMTKLTIKNVDSVISVSQFAKNELKREAGIDSKVVYNKINLKRFKDIDASKIRKKYHLKDEPIILFIGRISPHKGIHLLIDSFNLIKREIPNANLLIVGKSNYDDYIKKIKTTNNDSVMFVGYVLDEELPHYYAACDVYATASLCEAFNLPLAEAQACGKPVVAFDIGPHREIIDENGILVEKLNIEKFAEACVNKIREKHTYEDRNYY